MHAFRPPGAKGFGAKRAPTSTDPGSVVRESAFHHPLSPSPCSAPHLLPTLPLHPPSPSPSPSPSFLPTQLRPLSHSFSLSRRPPLPSPSLPPSPSPCLTLSLLLPNHRPSPSLSRSTTQAKQMSMLFGPGESNNIILFGPSTTRGRTGEGRRSRRRRGRGREKGWRGRNKERERAEVGVGRGRGGGVGWGGEGREREKGGRWAEVQGQVEVGKNEGGREREEREGYFRVFS